MYWLAQLCLSRVLGIRELGLSSEVLLCGDLAYSVVELCGLLVGGTVLRARSLVAVCVKVFVEGAWAMQVWEEDTKAPAILQPSNEVPAKQLNCPDWSRATLSALFTGEVKSSDVDLNFVHSI